MTRKWIFGVMGGVLLLGLHTVAAQEPPPGPPGPDIRELGGPIGPRMELLGFGEMHPGRVVTGAPYSAVAVTETKQTLADGNAINRKVQSNIFRDSQGRTRHETTFNAVGPLAASGQPRTAIIIHDPVASLAFVLHPDQKAAEQLVTPVHGPKNGANLQGRFEARMQEEIANGTLKKEDLGAQVINGVSTQGTRYTRTIPAGQIGNVNPLTITNEQWYSAELQVIVKSVRSDPRFGVTTYTLSNIQRTEPAASLFSVPSDYAVKQTTLGRHKGGPGVSTAPAGEIPPPPGP